MSAAPVSTHRHGDAVLSMIEGDTAAYMQHIGAWEDEGEAPVALSRDPDLLAHQLYCCTPRLCRRKDLSGPCPVRR